jgi:hypothetical protein
MKKDTKDTIVIGISVITIGMGVILYMLLLYMGFVYQYPYKTVTTNIAVGKGVLTVVQEYDINNKKTSGKSFYRY